MNIQSLSIPERILLAEQLWESVRTKSLETEASKELLELLDTRLAEFEIDGDVGDSWENVKERIIKK